MTNRWDIETFDLTVGLPPKDLASALINSEIAVVAFRNALPERPRMRALDTITTATTTINAYSNGSLTTIGPYLARHLTDLTQYFRRAGETDAVFPDPYHDLRRLLREAVRAALRLDSLDPLVEPDGSPYASAVVRLHHDGVDSPLHSDKITRDAAKTRLRVAATKDQLSAIGCIQECDAGGELVIYRRPWTPSDEVWKIPDALGYDEGLVVGLPSATFRPKTGDVYLINPTNPHLIRTALGTTRITLGNFISFFEPEPRAGHAWA